MGLDYQSIFKKLGSKRLPSEEYSFEPYPGQTDTPSVTQFTARHRPLGSTGNSDWQVFSDSRLPVFAENKHPTKDAPSELDERPDGGHPDELLSSYRDFIEKVHESIHIHRSNIEALNEWRDVADDSEGQQELIHQTLQTQRAEVFLSKIADSLCPEVCQKIKHANKLEFDRYEALLSKIRTETRGIGSFHDETDLQIMEDQLSCMSRRATVREMNTHRDMTALIGDFSIAISPDTSRTAIQDDHRDRIKTQRKNIQTATKVLEKQERNLGKLFRQRYGSEEEMPSSSQGWISLWASTHFKPGTSRIKYKLVASDGDTTSPTYRVRPEYIVDPEDPQEDWKPILDPAVPLFSGYGSHHQDDTLSACNIKLSRVLDGTGIPTGNFVNNVRSLLSLMKASKAKLDSLSEDTNVWQHEGGDLEKAAHLKRMTNAMKIMQETLPTILHDDWNTVLHSQTQSLNSELTDRVIADMTADESQVLNRWKSWMTNRVNAKTADALAGLYDVLASLTKEDSHEEYVEYSQNKDNALKLKAKHEEETRLSSVEFAHALPDAESCPSTLVEWNELLLNRRS
ncbi:hypothetical protein V865_005418 [Kwoniella europaea PYCC6329]|uniref:Uncharacterized protein n=1 Tax=Kwoniella europaea PYCC6329 TaxID=1423913 RepID=A0AAX4KP31_9TREE